MNLALADLSIVLPAFVAGCLVLVTHVPLGTQILSRGIVFIDLAPVSYTHLTLPTSDLV